jgi:hypothetical protein
MNPTTKLHELGQSLWLDNITRDLLGSGTLQRYVHDFAVSGLTSNPTIFEHAIRNTHLYGAHAQPARGLLQTASREQMQHLLVRSLFCQCVDERVRSTRQAAQTPAWFQHAHRRSALTCVPYFSMAVTHYTPRIIPHRVGAPVPLRAALVLSQ